MIVLIFAFIGAAISSVINYFSDLKHLDREDITISGFWGLVSGALVGLILAMTIKPDYIPVKKTYPLLHLSKDAYVVSHQWTCYIAYAELDSQRIYTSSIENVTTKFCKDSSYVEFISYKLADNLHNFFLLPDDKSTVDIILHTKDPTHTIKEFNIYEKSEIEKINGKKAGN